MFSEAGFAVSPIRIALAIWLVGFAGCYNPSNSQEGAPCQRSKQCPDPQQCVLGSCSLHAPPVDARPPPSPDAMLDAQVDATPLPCVTDGLSCGGTPTVFMCGNQCWVKCTGAVLRATAATACTNWMGALGKIDDATEESCVASHIISAAFWVGLIQGDGALTPGDKWTWNGTTPINYKNWATGEPNDGDGNETGKEQCATIRPGGGWDDDNCNQPLAFFCRRP